MKFQRDRVGVGGSIPGTPGVGAGGLGIPPDGPDYTAVVWKSGVPTNRRLGFVHVDWFPGVTSYANGTAYASMTDSAAGIRDAIAAAKAFGFEVRGHGTYRIESTVTIDTNADFSGATFVCNDTALTAVLIGTTAAGVRLQWLTVHAPAVIQAAKTTTGWVGTSVGIEAANLQRSIVSFPRVNGFVEGFRCTAYGLTGFVYNTVWMGHLDNNKINHHLLTTGTDATGSWVNENVFHGGGCSHESSEGSAVPGTRHILLTASGVYQPNNNLWVKASLESPLSPSVVEYMVESIGGVYNRWLQCRWESPGTPKVWWNQKDATYHSRDNVIDGGYAPELIAHTVSANSTRNNVVNAATQTIQGYGTNGIMRMRNANGGTLPVLAFYGTEIMTAGASGWQVQDGPTYRRSKLTADANPRFQITNTTGQMDWGAGAAAVDTTLSRGAADRLTMGAGDAFRTGAIAALPAASSAYRGYLYRVEGGTGVADALFICEKNASDAYVWRQI